MGIKIGINGLGRIGRMVIRSIVERKNKNIEIKHINNKANSEISALLLKHDSTHGKFNANINYDEKNLIINKKKISFSQETELSKINWKKYGVDIVLECTGQYNSKEKSILHIKNGAKKVIVSAPCKNADKTIVYGVNHKLINKNDIIISAASCTTNCLVPVAFIINKEFKISIEAATTDYWKKYIGENGLSFGIDNFGKSAPYKKIYEYFNLTSNYIVKKAKKMINS